MARAKKDGKYVNIYMERELAEMLKSYADEKGQTVTMAIERILQGFFDDQGITQTDIKNSIEG